MNTWNAFIVAFVLTAAISDLRTRTIPRPLTTIVALVGIIYHALTGGLRSSVAAMFIAFGLGFAFFWLGAIAGGDVKLITALGSVLGLHRWLLAMEVAIFAAALIALVQVAHSGVLLRTFVNIGDIVSRYAHHGIKPHPVLNASNPGALRSPFGLAAALGTILAVVVR